MAPASPHAKTRLADYVIGTLLFALILAVLAGALLPIYDSPRMHPKIVTTRSLLQEIGIALNHFKSDTGHFPTTAQGIPTLVAAPLAELHWHGPYLPAIPADAWKSPIRYTTPTPTTFTLISNGPDRTPDTEDDLRLPND